jgi:hypothetical protein
MRYSGINKKGLHSKRKELYNNVLRLACVHFEKEMPAHLESCLFAGPGTKHPVMLCTFLHALKELTGLSIRLILITGYGISTMDAQYADKRWRNYYKSHKELQKDVAIICMLVREKYCIKP